MFAGESLGHYVIKRHIKKTAKANVYLASRNDGTIKKDVVIKVEHKRQNDRRKNNTEAQNLFDLSGSNENICTVYDAGITEFGQKYIVIEYIDGLTLDQYFIENKTSIIDILKFFITICETIGHIHQHNIIHGDIKPENILITNDGQLKLINFESGRDDVFNTSINPLHLDSHHDIYSIGVMLKEVLSIASLGSDNQSLSAKNKFIKALPFKYRIFSNDLFNIVNKCLSQSDKYNTAYEVSLDISFFIKTKTPKATRSKPINEFIKGGVRNPYAFTSLSLMVISVISIVTMLFMQKSKLLDQKKQLTIQSAELINEKKSSEALLTHTQSLLSQVDPRARMGGKMSVRKLLEQGELKLINDKNMPNDIKAKMYITLGDSYYGLSAYSKSEKLYNTAFNLYHSQLDDMKRERIEVQVKILNTLNMQNKYDDSIALGGGILEKIINKGFTSPFEVEVLFSFNSAMRKASLNPDSFLAKVDFSAETMKIKENLWDQLSTNQKAKIFIFQINEIYYSLGKNSLSATSDLNSDTYINKAVPALMLARDKGIEALKLLQDNKVKSKLEVDLLFWLFRINFELRKNDLGNKYAEMAITKALDIYGPDHEEISRLHLVQYAMFSSTDVKRSLKEMELSYDIIDKTLDKDDWERFYYLDTLSQAYLNAGMVNKSVMLMHELFDKVEDRNLDDVSKRAFDGISSSLFRFIDLNELDDIPNNIQKLYALMINKYDELWPGWLTRVDKDFLFLTNAVIAKKPINVLRKSADSALDRLLNHPQSNDESALYYDVLICSELIRIYDYIGDKNKISQVYGVLKGMPQENDAYMINTINEIQSKIITMSIMKRHGLAKGDIINFKNNSLYFLNENNLLTPYYQEKFNFL